MHPLGWKPRAKQQFSAGRTIFRSSRTSRSNQIGHAPVRLEAQSQTAVQCRPSDSSQQRNNSSQKATFQTEPREIGGSPQGLFSGGLRGGGLYGLPGAEKQHSGIKKKQCSENRPRTIRKRKRILYRLAEIFTSMMRDNRGRLGDVARSLGGILVTHLVDPDCIRRYLGKCKRISKNR